MARAHLPLNELRRELEALYAVGVARADPARAVREALTERDGCLANLVLDPKTRLFVLAAGKAALAMAQAVEQLAGERIVAGIAVTKDRAPDPQATPKSVNPTLTRIALRFAGHPIPDARSERAGREVLEFLHGLQSGDVLLVLLSGGASALLACPAPGISLEALQATQAALLGSGAAIAELNRVRKHLTLLSGGRLAAIAPDLRKEVLIVSDVIGDDPSVIGSGPWAPDASNFADALAVLERYHLLECIPAPVVAFLRENLRTSEHATITAGAQCFRAVRHHLLVTNRDACEAMAIAACARGFRVFLAPTPIRGEARDMGHALATLVKAAQCRERTLWILGGETTVTLTAAPASVSQPELQPGRVPNPSSRLKSSTRVGVNDSGCGGRSQELALAAALALDGVQGVGLFAAGSDGIDGMTQAAGAFVDGDTLARARRRGLDARDALWRHASGSFFEQEGGRFAPGPTGTNVMDFVLIARDP